MLLPIVVVAVALIIILVTSRESIRRTVDSEPAGAPDQPVSATPTKNRTVDDEGRVVYYLGAIEIRVPASENPTSVSSSTGATSLVQVGICWPRDPLTDECPGIANVAIVFLKPGRIEPKVVEDGLAQLHDRLPDGLRFADPNIPGVWAFPSSNSDQTSYYALAEPDATGRHIIARCRSGPRCRAWATVSPGLIASYTFDKTHLVRWPELNQRIVDHARTYLVEE